MSAGYQVELFCWRTLPPEGCNVFRERLHVTQPLPFDHYYTFITIRQFEGFLKPLTFTQERLINYYLADDVLALYR